MPFQLDLVISHKFHKVKSAEGNFICYKTVST